MRGLLILLLASQLAAQEGPPLGILRGELLKWDPAGGFNLSTRNRRMRICTFDTETYLTSKGSKISAEDVRAGNIVEVVVDRRGEPGRCHALTIYVLPELTARTSADYLGALERQRHVIDHIFPRGNLTFAGIVLESDSDHMVVRTRSEGRKTLQLRNDTRYTDDGRPSDTSMLEVNTRIFIRAGRGIDGELEAYQVIRGRILIPR